MQAPLRLFGTTFYMRARPRAQKATRPMTDLAAAWSAPAVTTTEGVGRAVLLPGKTVSMVVAIRGELSVKSAPE